MTKCKQFGTTKLFQVVTIVKEYSGCKGVTFYWFFADERSSPRPYADLIADYNPGTPYIEYAEARIDELFTEAEASQLIAYLDCQLGDEGMTTIEEEKLPIPSNVMGFGTIAVGGPQDFYMLHKAPGYPLPFKAFGYFDLRASAPCPTYPPINDVVAEDSDDEISF